ncbi:MAG: ATP synthase F1 subunit delta [Candidatus Krumholzibacteria bacterium]|jgi:F-type H+-transporting ATPase subunit delta|nr:ATP synthase F1 subunit delta [Candidatus Krumholzibacteria bacterium]
MRDHKVALRYSRALLAVAADRDMVDALDESYAGLAQIIAGHPEFALFLENPQVPLAQKKALIGRVLGERVEPLLIQFLDLLLDKGRIQHLADIQTAFAALVEDYKGLQRATVTTAVPLAADLEARLVEKLAGLTGRRIVLEKNTDSSVLGGVCVTMGDFILDGTLRTGLRRLREALEAAPLKMS